MDIGVKFPDVHVRLTGRDSDVFAIMGVVIRALKDAGHADAVDEFTAEMADSGGYRQALAVVMRTVKVS